MHSPLPPPISFPLLALTFNLSPSSMLFSRHLHIYVGGGILNKLSESKLNLFYF